MPTIFTHAVIPLAAGLALGRKALSPRLVAAGVLAAIAPDFDSIAFKLGIAYADQFGHRGASHSFVFALMLGLLAAIVAPWLRTTRWRAFLFIAACTASHPLLDAFTDGGLGVALLWPWSHERLFAPWRPIEVSPIGAGFFSLRGVEVLWSEAKWVVLPILLLTVPAWGWRAKTRPRIRSGAGHTIAE
jgi:inner membrane protein